MTRAGSLVATMARLTLLVTVSAPGRTRRMRETRVRPAEAAPLDPPRTQPASTAHGRLPMVPALAGKRGAIRDLELGEFVPTSGRVAVNGRILSSRRTVSDFVVVLEWLDEDGEVRGRGVVILADVAPGEKRWFTLATRVQDLDETVRCVPQAYAGVLETAGAA